MPVLFSALVTGAAGFVGRSLTAALAAPPAALALGPPGWEERVRAAPMEGMTIFHLAARVHAPDDRDEAAFQRDNVEKTRRLAEEAARKGARRLVYLSSCKVYGEESGEHPLGVGTVPSPGDAYARSKLTAEEALARIASERGLEVVTVRSALVLGPGAKGNVESLMGLADRPWPLPFAAIANRRSFVHVDDLVRLLVACGEHPSATGATFNAAHPEPLSTPALVESLRRHLGRAPRLFPVAPGVLEAAAAMAGQGPRMRRLTRSFELDASATARTVGWNATVDLDAAAGGMARAWRTGWK